MKKSLIKSIFALVLASAILGIAQPSFASKPSDINKKRKNINIKTQNLQLFTSLEEQKTDGKKAISHPGLIGIKMSIANNNNRQF